MPAAMAAENRRREVAAMTPGLGVPLPMEQPTSGPSVGKYGVGGDIVGEGYDQQAEISGAVHKSHGESRPVYAAPAVAGESYAPLAVVQPALRHVRAAGFDVVSPPGRLGLLARVLGRIRGHR